MLLDSLIDSHSIKSSLLLSAFVFSFTGFTHPILNGKPNLNGKRDKYGDFYQYAGVIHVHTTYSDGGGSFDEIAQVAKSIGLDYVITTDHDTIEPYNENHSRLIDKVLVVPGVEVSTDNRQGHFLVFGDKTPIDCSNGICSDEVFRDSVDRGLITFLAHACHPNPKWDWKDWNNAEFTGMEIFNLDSCWKECLKASYILRLFVAWAFTGFRDTATRHVLKFPKRELEKFDELNENRKVVAIGAVDAHSKARVTKYLKWWIRYPSYRTIFKAVTTNIITRSKFTGDYKKDSEILFDALRRGNSYIGFPITKNPLGFEFTASSNGETVTLGETVSLNGHATLHYRFPASKGLVVQIIRNGKKHKEITPPSSNGEFSGNIKVEQPGNYRIQAFLKSSMPPFPGSRLYPWIITNPIYIRNG